MTSTTYLLLFVPALTALAPEAPDVTLDEARGWACADFDGDGDGDLYLARPEGDRLLVTEGDGFVRAHALERSPTHASRAVSAKDIDLDGRADLLLLGADGRLRLLRALDDFAFEELTHELDVGANVGIQRVAWIERGTAAPELLPELLIERLDGSVDLLVRHEGLGFVRHDALAASPPVTSVAARVTAPSTPDAPLVEEHARPTSKATPPRSVARVRSGERAQSSPRFAATEHPAPAHGSPSHEALQAGNLRCANTLRDQGGPGCLPASSVPELGSLYPLSSNLYVAPGGQVGIQTTSPTDALSVVGDVGLTGAMRFARDTDGIVFSNVSGASSPMLQMFQTTGNADRMLVGHSTSFPNWGIRYDDSVDDFVFQRAAGDPVLGIGLGSDELDAYTDLTLHDSDLVLTAGSGTLASLINDISVGGGAELSLHANSGTRTFEIDADANGGGDPFMNMRSANTFASVHWDTVFGGTLNLYSTDGLGNVGLSTAAGAIAVFGRQSANSTLPAIHGVSDASLSNAQGILGEIRDLSPGSYSAGIRGQNKGTGFSGVGVYGSHDGNGFGVLGSAAGTSGYGVVGDQFFGGTAAVAAFGDLVVTGTKAFAQPHPSDPTKEIRFAALEGNESGTYFRGSARLVAGSAVIEVPEEFALVTEPAGITVTLTAVGARADLWIRSKDLERVVVAGEPDVGFDYLVQGTRRGFANEPLVHENTSFVPRVRGVPFGPQYPRGVRDMLVENGLLNADYTPNEALADRKGWTLIDAAELLPPPTRRAKHAAQELVREGPGITAEER